MEQHPETVVEHTINAMRDAIRDGRFAPGQRLVVAEVTKLLGVSAGPVREAYLVGSRDAADPDSWRTEIGWPIFRVSPI